MVGKKAPEFCCSAVVDGNIKTVDLQDFGDCYKVLLFYPLDFTFVCPTELHAFQDSLVAFNERNTIILGISVDSVYSHLAWLRTPKKEGGIQGVAFPLLSDITKDIARSYDVLHPEEGVALRGMFILDKNNYIQVAHCNNLPLGRNVAEVLRLIDALQEIEKHGAVCPANWQQGQEVMRPTTQGVKEYFD